MEAHMLGASIKKKVHRGQKRQELNISLSSPVRKSALDDNKDVVCLQLNQQDVWGSSKQLWKKGHMTGFNVYLKANQEERKIDNKYLI